MTYIAWEGKLSNKIETIDSSAAWSAIVTGPAANQVNTQKNITLKIQMTKKLPKKCWKR